MKITPEVLAQAELGLRRGERGASNHAIAVIRALTANIAVLRGALRRIETAENVQEAREIAGAAVRSPIDTPGAG
jgi:hypothetical protein